MAPGQAIVRIDNPRDPSRPALTERAVVDPDAMHLRIPWRVARQLGLEPVDRRELEGPNGQRQSVPYVGPIEVHYLDRRCYVGAVVIGEGVSLGLLALEEMDLVEPSRAGPTPKK